MRLRSVAAWKEAEGAPRAFPAPGAAEKRRLLPRALGGWARPASEPRPTHRHRPAVLLLQGPDEQRGLPACGELQPLRDPLLDRAHQ